MNRDSWISFDGWVREDAILELWKHATPLRTVDGAPSIEFIRNQPDDIDYMYGRPLKICLDHWPLIDPFLYDRDNGIGKMQSVANRHVEAHMNALATSAETAKEATELYNDLFG